MGPAAYGCEGPGAGYLADDLKKRAGGTGGIAAYFIACVPQPAEMKRDFHGTGAEAKVSRQSINQWSGFLPFGAEEARVKSCQPIAIGSGRGEGVCQPVKEIA